MADAQRPAGPRRGYAGSILRLYAGLYLGYLLLPLVILVLYAFNASEYLVWPPAGFTLEWFGRALADSRMLTATRNSVFIGLVSTALSTLVGTLLALGLVRFRFRFRSVLETVNILAIVTYGVVSAVSVLLWFRTLGIAGGIWPTIIGHTTFIMPFAVMVVRDRLLNFDRRLEEAAMDLGAGPLQTFRDVTLPLILPAVLAAALFCFTISMGEFLLAFFLIGNDLTLPVYLYGLMRFTFTPAVNAAAAVIIAVPVLAVVTAALFFRRHIHHLH